MKPAETLGMLEEAAGTRMYEDKKEKAKATIKKKQVKLDEINVVSLQQLTDTMQPAFSLQLLPDCRRMRATCDVRPVLCLLCQCAQSMQLLQSEPV